MLGSAWRSVHSLVLGGRPRPPRLIGRSDLDVGRRATLPRRGLVMLLTGSQS
jgi:hypothetical protein